MPTLVYINYIPARRCRLCAEATGCQKGSSAPKTKGTFPALGEQQAPSNAKLRFIAGQRILTAPYYWGYFRPEDLTEVEIKGSAIVDDFSFAVISATQQTGLSKLKLDNLVLTERAFKNIGDIKTLHGLALEQIHIADAAGNSPRELIPSDLLSLPNFHNLTELSIGGVEKATPFLDLLKNRKISLLGLSPQQLTLKDVGMLKDLPALECLSLYRSVDQELNKELDQLAELPKLRILRVVDASAVPYDSKAARRFPKLEKLEFYSSPDRFQAPADLQKIQTFLKQWLPSHCDLTFGKTASTTLETKTDHAEFSGLVKSVIKLEYPSELHKD